ncbi:pimeloyl-ACP methyl ester carboxylesterase [Kibdelosporangium banguiense]|uniref:Pimeloyl-ACP methyl ester carboxylesterase n=1 Tax=Kibdelosporangium banguiense TaxID=1365924 RepID=A0ABS4TQD4_9PSEU|nr:alpha/beta hydrolase [Kibdelosporangium banguiense]MBP2326625.1 pimeloyl-ACP methyl ester carboxylesterase [Kibdelosporangium banguiense]
MKRALTCFVAAVLGATVLVTPSASAQTAPTGYSGTLPDGATWVARVPSGWNGTVVLFSHGFRPGPENPAADSPDPATADALLAKGFALAGSSYARPGWALDTAVQDQLDTLAALRRHVGPAREVIALGQSMGGLVSALLAERSGRNIDGALTTCGLVGGALNLNNYQLDGTYAMAQLLLPGQPIQLTRFTTPAEANATVSALTNALRTAQATPAGRARIALAGAMMNAPTWFTGPTPPSARDWAVQQEAQYNWLVGTLPFVIPARITINAVAGGDSSWNVGVNYAKLLHESAQSSQVAGLYRQAGLDLRADLATLSRNATIAPEPAAVRWLARTSVPTGRLSIPELTLHTLADSLAPVEYHQEYGGKVRRAGAEPLLRQTYVSRIGHCAFTPAEHVAALLAVQNRIRTGTWRSATPEALQATAESLNLGGAAFVRYQPPPFVNDRH